MNAKVNVGLTFYGGVSLAVFEAGIAYELVRAVQFSRIGNRPGQVPEIHVDVVTGTSAGGLAAVQLAAALAGSNTEAVLAKILAIWANDADILSLLPESRFQGQGFLDNRRLSECVESILETASAPVGKRLEDDLEAVLTLTNLSGLCEPVVLAEDAVGPAFPTTRYVEYERFNADQVTHRDHRQRFIDAATITAGFPVAFPPMLKTSGAIEENKAPADATRFVYIDGGVMDNRPIGVALDAIAEKPAPQRLFFFIDPNETWVPPSYGAGDLDDRRLDPAGIYLKLNGVARSDSIYHDLQRVRGMCDALAVLEPLSRLIFLDADFRRKLLSTDAYQQIVTRTLNPEAHALWQLVQNAVGAEVRAQWARVHDQERFSLRARMHEFVDRLAEEGAIGATEVEKIGAAIDTIPAWPAYYIALGELRALDRRFRQLSWELWHDHFRHMQPGPSGAQTGQAPLPEPLQQRIANAFEALAEAAAKLREIREAIAVQMLEAEVLAELKAGPELKQELQSRFFDYARAMQVLEALAGIRSSPNLTVRRMTPFDIYPPGTDLTQAKPLAGGAVGAFGGFLDKEWRLNDFFVGRRAMRAHLQREQLIPETALEDYLAWSKSADLSTAERLSPSSAERDALTRFAGLGGAAGAPTLQPHEMAVDMLPGSRIAYILRKLLGSTHRLLRMNANAMPYRALSVLTPVLPVLAALVWMLEQSLRPLPHAYGDTSKALNDRLKWYAGVLFLGLLAGIFIGLFIG
jgi:predicted acylesterase/phospholipase RssA